MKKLILFIIVILFTVIFLFPEEEKKIEVIARSANIRATANLKAEIIGKAAAGDKFIIRGKEGDWYRVLLGDAGNKSGFLHRITVKEVTETIEVLKHTEKRGDKKKITKKKPKKRKPKKIKKKRIKYQKGKLFSGFFLKGGLMTSPSGVNFGNSWILSFGFDKPIGKFLTWGFEFQPYYRSETIPVFLAEFSTLSGNLFLNVKGGMKLFRKTSIYLGAGAGSQLSYQSIKSLGLTQSEFIANFIWHILLGTEFEIGNLNLILEFQFDKTIYKDIEPSTFSTTFLMFGIRF